MIGEWWYFSHIGPDCWGIMRDMTGYEATMLRSRSNILLTLLKHRWAAVFWGTQVSQLLTLDLPVMLCSLLVFNHTGHLWPISLRFLLLNVKLSWTDGLTRWKYAVQLCATMMLAPPWMTGEEFCKSRFYVDMHGNFRHQRFHLPRVFLLHSVTCSQKEKLSANRKISWNLWHPPDRSKNNVNKNTGKKWKKYIPSISNNFHLYLIYPWTRK